MDSHRFHPTHENQRREREDNSSKAGMLKAFECTSVLLNMIKQANLKIGIGHWLIGSIPGGDRSKRHSKNENYELDHPVTTQL